MQTMFIVVISILLAEAHSTMLSNVNGSVESLPEMAASTPSKFINPIDKFGAHVKHAFDVSAGGHYGHSLNDRTESGHCEEVVVLRPHPISVGTAEKAPVGGTTSL
jgi:hypothetical protein